MIDRARLSGHPLDAARLILGSHLVSDIGPTTRLRVSEVEAYAPDDPASHSFRGETARNQSMFGHPGILYVYRSYGIHWCANVSTGEAGTGAAVLLRAGDILEGRDTIRKRRNRSDHLTDGPGKLCQALGIHGEHDGVDLLDEQSPIRLEPGDPMVDVEATPRIGISKAVDLPWRLVGRAGPVGG